MARGELLKRLLSSYGLEEDFRAAAEQIIYEEEKKNNRILAKTLRRSLESSLHTDRTTSAPDKTKGLLPLPPMSDSVGDFVEHIDTGYSHKDIVLSSENVLIFSDLIREFRLSEKIRKKGLPVRSKLLFCGPPGCGKTITAEAFAARVGLPLFVVKIDRLISSFLGETASNIRKIFEFTRREPCVLFLDEFDAIARARDDVSEHSELRRVVNSLLIFIDRIQPKGFLIAATNYHEALDSAIWRRFDEVIWFEKPNLTMVSRFLKLRYKNVELDFSTNEVVPRLEDYSYAELERVVVNSLKSAIISNRKVVVRADFDKAYKNEERRRAGQKINTK